MLIDHQKDLYSQDFMLLKEYGVLDKAHIIIADNIIHPGAPEYLKMMK